MTNEQENQKQPYEKPAIIHRQSIESVASACDSNGNGKGDQSCSVINS